LIVGGAVPVLGVAVEVTVEDEGAKLVQIVEEVLAQEIIRN